MASQRQSIDSTALLAAAEQAANRAYAPYSQFHVGAAILLDDGRIYTGCNVENISYGLTNCAERTAIFTAVAASESKPRVVAVAVVNAQGKECSPCGACRQVMSEFCAPDARITYRYGGKLRELAIGDILPDAFQF